MTEDFHPSEFGILPPPTEDAMTWDYLENLPKMVVTFPTALSQDEANAIRDQWLEKFHEAGGSKFIEVRP